jgi:hypothetical protein
MIIPTYDDTDIMHHNSPFTIISFRTQGRRTYMTSPLNCMVPVVFILVLSVTSSSANDLLYLIETPLADKQSGGGGGGGG